MKRWKTYQIILFTLLCLGINYGGRVFSQTQEWFVWLDAYGTIMGAYIGGPVVGAVIGASGNLIYAICHQGKAVYAVVSIALALVVGLGVRRSKVSTLMNALGLSVLAAFVSTALSVPLNIFFYGGQTGNKWGDATIGYFLEAGAPEIVADFLGEFFLEFVDKSIMVMVFYLLVHAVRRFRARKQGLSGKTAVKVSTGEPPASNYLRPELISGH